MLYSVTNLLAVAAFATSVSAHGFVVKPQARLAGAAMAAACGTQVFNNQAADNYGNIQGVIQVGNSQSDYDEAACNVWLCKGFKFADNTANVQSYVAGQVVSVTVEIRAPHTGYANVSIVDTATNTLISAELASWDVYASNSAAIPANQTQFDITIPTDLGSKCATAGDCVIQWYWNAESIDQTYEACIDFTLDSSSSAPATSAASVTTRAVAVPTTIQTQTRPIVTNASVNSVTEVAATTTAETALTETSSTTASPTSTVQAMPAGTTFKDLVRWLNDVVASMM